MESTPVSKHSFGIAEVLNEAWNLVRGSKWPIWAIAIFIGISSLIVQLIIIGIFRIDAQASPTYYQYLLMPIINNVVVAPFFAGAVMTGIKRARGEAIEVKTGFRYFNKTWQVMVAMLLIAFLANILNYIVHLPSIVIALNLHAGWLNIIAAIVSILVYVFTLFSVPLIVDKNHSPWGALLASFHIIKKSWFKVLILLIIVYVFFIIAAIPLFVGAMIHPYAKLLGAIILIVALVWLLPFMFLVQGALYHQLVDRD